MQLLPCGHVAYLGESRLCLHLLGEDATDTAVALLTGDGLRHDLCCSACDELREAGQEFELVDACEGCVGRIADDQWNPAAWRGEPGIRHRPERIDETLIRTQLTPDHSSPLDFTAIPDHANCWLLLTRDHDLVVLDAEVGTTTASVPVELAAESEPSNRKQPRLRVHCSNDGTVAAVVNDYGRHGVVLGLETKQLTMRLDRGVYHVEQTPFPLCFLDGPDGVLVVHATDWNRVDVSQARTGELLTSRGPTTYQGKDRPQHYLDYFHGALHVSPNQQRIADDGWVWHPVGIPVAWDVRRWLQTNVWESEDGPSRCDLAFRAYHWDVPMCWVDDTLLAISGLGSDDEAMLAGAIVINADTGREQLTFAGPAGAFFADQRRLYSAGADGLAIWDPATGEQTGLVAGFAPTRQHRGAAELAVIEGDTLIRWRTPSG